MNTTQPERARNKMEEQSERRRRTFAVQGRGRLGVDPALLDFHTYVYRWLNDEPGRLVMKTKHDDWTTVPNAGEKEDSTDLGTMISIVVGTLPDGSPKRAYLCRKLKTYFDDDAAAAQAVLDKQLADLRRGLTRAGESQSDYVPTSGIRMDA